ncbi:MAG: DNA cytosine methyltransferase [Candidatus Omnitrophica bacterium]|nr:DNA cytosine methyltransferase [Candidatus Omnitrophota bacterium]
MAKKTRLNVLDLFCGAGGFSEGFRQSGYNILSGIDNDKNTLDTFARNFPKAVAIQKDLSEDNFSGMDKIINEQIDVIIGGPPCQGFSVAGKRLKDDPRNILYKAYLNLIKHFNPKAVVIENVPTILGLYGGEIGRQIVEDLEQLKYKVKVHKVITSDYGIPQTRRRVFFVGLHSKKDFCFPEGRYIKSPVTSAMAISDLPLLNGFLGELQQEYPSKPKNEYQASMRKKSRYLWNHQAVEHKQRTIDIVKMVPDGGNYKDLPEHLWATRKVNIAWTRMNSEKPCFTIDAGHNHHFHYKANRVPTVRECARIQSFPDRFIFYGNRTSQYRQVGNAVPPMIAKILATSLKKVISL